MMKNYSKYICLMIMISSALAVKAEEDADTIPTYLQELVVESKNAWIEKDHVVFMPTRKEKNRANSPQTLIQQINIPYIRIDNKGEMTNLKGDKVAVFINGFEATGIDLSTFWPKNVTRVEYFENPADPKYKGYPSVVNFIVTEYALGGVTRAMTNQSFLPYSSRYNVASKLTYKRMTYGLQVNASVFNQKEGDNEERTSQTYNDVWYDGNKYDRISSENISTTAWKYDNVNAAFNAVYTDDKTIRLVHTVSLSWNKSNNNDIGSMTWTPLLFNSDYSRSHYSSRSLSPQISGKYIFALSQKWQLITDWHYGFARNKRESSSQTADLQPILNGHTENAHNVMADALITYFFNPKTNIQLQLSESANIYSIQYNGTYDQASHQSMSMSKMAVRWFWRPRQNFYINAIPGFTIDVRSIREAGHDTSVNPYFYLASDWYQSDKAFLSVYANYGTRMAGASQANEVLQRLNELMWSKGNPDLANEYTFTWGLQQTWMPAEWITPTLNIRYIDWNYPFSDYQPAPEDMGGLISQTRLCTDRTWTFSLNLSSSLLHRNLRLNFSPEVRLHSNSAGSMSRTLNTFNFNGNVNYSLGNFNLNVSYVTPQKAISSGGHDYQYRPDRWDAGISYGNGDLYASFNVSNIFRTYTTQTFSSIYDYYMNEDAYRQRGRSFSFNLTYTFGYGKKVNRNIDIQEPTQISSGAAGGK